MSKCNNKIENLEVLNNKFHSKLHATSEKMKILSKLGYSKRWGKNCVTYL